MFPVYRATFPSAWAKVHRDVAIGTPRRRDLSSPGERRQLEVGRFWADTGERQCLLMGGMWSVGGSELS